MPLPEKINPHLLNFACESCAWFVFITYWCACVSTYIETFVIGVHEFNCTWYLSLAYFIIIYVKPTYTTCTEFFLTCLFKLKSKLYIFSCGYFFFRSHIEKFAHAVVTVYQPPIFSYI